MICKIQVVTVSEDGCQETLEIACVERTDLKPETLGLTLAEGKMILNDLQQIVVERQVSSSLLLKQACPDCGQRRCSKGNHTLSLRTVFGQLTVRSPRMHHCVCRPHKTKTFSPLAELLPNHTLPELLFLETKWASLMSYGMTSKLLQDVLPIDEPVNTFTIRQHVADVAERLEQELGDEQFCFVEGCQRSWDELPSPDGPLTVGIDGGYVRGQQKQGQLEVIAGKSLLAFKRDQEGKQQLSGRCFAWVQTYDEKPKRRLFELLQSQGMQPNQQVDFLSDGGSVATLQEWSDMLGQCSLRQRFPVCSSGGNSNRKSSFWRLVGICVFPCRTGTSRSCSPREVCTPITSRCGVGSSGMPQKWNDVCALGSDRPTTVGEWTKPTSGSRASGSIYAGLSTPAERRSTSFCRLNATQQRPSAFSPRLWAERTIRRRGSSTPTSTPVIHRRSCGSKPRRL